MNDLNPQVREVGRLERLYLRLTRKAWWWFLPAAHLLYAMTRHCDSPEYFKAHPKMVRWTGGIRTASWTWMCGHGLKFSLHMGNIYWKIGKKELAAKGVFK